MTVPLDETFPDAARLIGLLRALEARAFTDRIGRDAADLARTDLDETLQRIVPLLPSTGAVSAQWTAVDALSARLLLDELTRAVDRLRFLATLSRAHLESAAASLRTVEKGRRKLAERW